MEILLSGINSGGRCVKTNDDFETLVRNISWRYDAQSKCAVATIDKKIVKFHRFLLGVTDNSVLVVCLDGDYLNCTIENLEIVSRSDRQKGVLEERRNLGEENKSYKKRVSKKEIINPLDDWKW